MAKKSTVVLTVDQILAQAANVYTEATNPEFRPAFGDAETFGTLVLSRRLVMEALNVARSDEVDALRDADSGLASAQRELADRINNVSPNDREALRPAAYQAIGALRLIATQLEQPDQLDRTLKLGIAEVATVAADHLEETVREL
jgi:hypothetical protein